MRSFRCVGGTFRDGMQLNVVTILVIGRRTSFGFLGRRLTLASNGLTDRAHTLRRLKCVMYGGDFIKQGPQATFRTASRNERTFGSRVRTLRRFLGSGWFVRLGAVDL